MRSFYILFLMLFAFCMPEAILAARGDRSSNRSNVSRSSGDSQSARRGVSGGRNKNKARGESRGRIAVGTPVNRTRLKVDLPKEEKVVEEEDEEEGMPEVEELEKTVAFKDYTTALNALIKKASKSNDRVGFDVKRYSSSGEECVSNFEECAEQSSICGNNLSRCLDLSEIELEEKTWFCQKTLMKKCAPDVHEDMFDQFVESIEMARAAKVDKKKAQKEANRPICKQKIERCFAEECRLGDYPYAKCFTAEGLDQARSACQVVVDKCEKDYAGQVDAVLEKIEKAAEKDRDEKVIFETACLKAFGVVRGDECMRMITVKYDNKTQVMEIPLSEQPTRQLCTHESLQEAVNAYNKKKKQKIAKATGIGAAVGFGAGALTHGILKKTGKIDEDNKYIKNFFSGTGKGLFNSEKRREKLSKKENLSDRKRKKLERMQAKSAAFDVLSDDDSLSNKERRKKLRKIKDKDSYEDEIGDYKDVVEDTMADEKADFSAELKTLAKSYGKEKPKRSDINKDCKEMCEGLDLKYMKQKDCVNQCKDNLKNRFHPTTWGIEDFKEKYGDLVSQNNRDMLSDNLKEYCARYDEKENCNDQMFDAIQSELFDEPVESENIVEKEQGKTTPEVLEMEIEEEEEYDWDSHFAEQERLDAEEEKSNRELEKSIADMERQGRKKSRRDKMQKTWSNVKGKFKRKENEKSDQNSNKKIADKPLGSIPVKGEEIKKVEKKKENLSDKEYNVKKIKDFQKRTYISKEDLERYEGFCRGSRKQKKKCTDRLNEIYEGRRSSITG